MDFAGVAALQAVCECPLRPWAGIEINLVVVYISALCGRIFMFYSHIDIFSEGNLAL